MNIYTILSSTSNLFHSHCLPLSVMFQRVFVSHPPSFLLKPFSSSFMLLYVISVSDRQGNINSLLKSQKRNTRTSERGDGHGQGHETMMDTTRWREGGCTKAGGRGEHGRGWAK